MNLARRTRLFFAAAVVALAVLVGCGTLPASNSLKQGIYTLSNVSKCQGIDNSGTSLVQPAPSVQISENGLPIFDGKESAVGVSNTLDFGSLTLTVTTRSVVPSPNGVVLTNDVHYDVDPPGDDSGDLTGVSTVTLTQTGLNTIRYQLYMVVGSNDGNSLILDCDGNYSR